MYLIGKKKPLKLDKKIRRTTGRSINKKHPKLHEKIRRKINHLLLCNG